MKVTGSIVWSGLLLLLVSPASAQFGSYPEAELKGRFRSQSKEVRIDHLAATVEIDGDVATTTLKLAFAHSTPQRLEGDLIFAIPPGATISDFQMSVNGKLRDGVMVAKDLARSVFDRLVRWRIDPGVVEWVDGERYRLSVFPIEPEKQKIAVIRYEQEIPLSFDGRWLEFALPLGFRDRVGMFELDVKVRNTSAPPLQTLSDFPALQFQKNGNAYQASLSMPDFRALPPLELKISQPDQSQVFTSPAENGETYFYLRHLIEDRAPKPKPRPQRIGVLWDVSTSSMYRDVEREVLLLGAYLKALGEVELMVVKVGEDVSSPMPHRIQDGQWEPLRDELLHTKFDGGSRYSAVNLATYDCDEFLLFGDGLSTFGSSGIDPRIAPIYVIRSGHRLTNHYQLNWIALQSGGNLIDLSKLDHTQSLSALLNQQYRFLGFREGGAIRNLYPSQPADLSTEGVSGVVLPGRDHLTLTFGYGSEAEDEVQISVRNPQRSDDLAKRLWERKKLAEFRAMPKNKNAWPEEAERMGIVTSRSSFLVLDRIEDYVNNFIPPPASEPNLLADYHLRVQNRFPNRLPQGAVQTKLTRLHNSLEQKERWYEDDYDWLDQTNVYLARNGARFLAEQLKFEPENRLMKIDLDESQTILQEATALEVRWMNLAKGKDAYNVWLADALELQSRLQPLMDRYEERYIAFYQEKLEIERRREATIQRFNEIQRNRGFRRHVSDDPFADLGGDSGGGGFAPPPPLPTGKDTPDEPNRDEAQGPKADWTPNAPFLQTIASRSSLEEMEEAYFQLKKLHIRDPLFYVDAGDLFLRRGYQEAGLRILSNIAELGINDVQLLRMLGYRLRALNQRSEALQIFEQIFALRGDDPQTLRDLALAHYETGNAQKAADLLWEVIQTPWPDHHGNIAEVALNEWNALLADQTVQIDTSQFKQKLQRHFPVDLRIVMTWDTDLADIDLVVFDPANSYPEPEDPITRTGDLLTGDIMGGYGPEEFLVRRALPGRYSIRANYNSRSDNRLNSPTTVYVDLTTNFGRPNAETRRYYRRIQPSQSGVEIARFVYEVEIDAD